MNNYKIFCSFILMSLLAFSQTFAEEGLSVRQKILMPGPVIEGHAEYEAKCETCHSAFDKKEMTSLCLDCHEEISEDRAKDNGFHGKTGSASVEDCQLCHKDHKGRDTDITGLLESTFNHDATNFPLNGGHESISCESCHKDETQKYRDTPSVCFDCHKNDDVHNGATGKQCESCHQDTSWQALKVFNHDTTDFELLGAHKDVSCLSCHIAQKFTFEEQSCISCHQSSDVHGGSHGTQCESCHNEKNWDSVIFDHDNTNFPLLDKHKEIPCRACHESGEQATDAPTECNGCHKKNDIHFGRNGTACENCHTTKMWQEILFDHNTDTDFLLTGKHHEVSCTQCHIGALKDSLPRDCASCHQADDVHNSPEMAECSFCHTTTSWQSTSLFNHEFTAFPLIGMHRIVPCSSCHIANQFAGTHSECFSCHQNDDIHQNSLGKSCDQCHNPNAWNPWEFDHNSQTEFDLDGKHKNLSCDSCHLPGTSAEDTSKVCGTCHQSQDIHNGEFGPQCDRCHSTSGFFELFIR